MEVARTWYRKGYEAGKRENPSGCYCEINENDEIVSWCAMHAAERDKIVDALIYCIAEKAGIPWSKVTNEQINYYIKATEDLGGEYDPRGFNR